MVDVLGQSTQHWSIPEIKFKIHHYLKISFRTSTVQKSGSMYH